MNFFFFQTKTYSQFSLHTDMSQFGLGSANSHWGYSSASYSPYLTSGGLSTCGTTSAAQFNNPELGFSCSATDQTSTQDFTNNTRECLPSKFVPKSPALFTISKYPLHQNHSMHVLKKNKIKQQFHQCVSHSQCYPTQQLMTWISI